MSSKTKSTATKEEATSALVPKLRFPEFRGKEGWTEKPLKAAAHINPGNDGLPESFIYIDLESVEAGNLKAKNRISREGSPSRAQRLVEHGDIIFQVVRPYQRNNLLCEFDDDDDYVASTGYAQLRAKGSNRFLYQSIHTDSFVGRVMAKCTGSNYPAINSSDLADIQLPLPATLPEQQKIAECLSSVDELMAAQARKVDALKTHKKGLMQQLFPREGETQPRLRFPEFQNAEEWVSDSLGNIFETTSGGTPSRTEKAYWNGEVPWVTTSLVDFGVITSAEEYITSEGLKNSSAKLFPEGTVLMAMYGQGKTRGQVALLGIEAATNQACAAILPRKDIDPYFVFLNLAGRYEEIRKMSNSGGQENLSQGLIKEIWFAFPPHDDEQHEVTKFLGSLDALITAETQKIEALKTHKKGLMQQLFPSSEEAEA